MKRVLAVLVVLTSLVLVFTAMFRRPDQVPNNQTQITSSQESKIKAISIDGKQFTVEVADDAAERQKGLSGREELDSGSGMLFVFDMPSKQCFWMKDTLIPLDMLWFDANYQLIHIAENVKPESYPESFCPDKDALYVVELAGGVAAQSGLKIGDVLTVK